MNELTYLLRHWLGKHDITREGVRIIISFPSEREMFRAQQAVKYEVTQIAGVTIMSEDAISTMNGIGLTLAHHGPVKA